MSLNRTLILIDNKDVTDTVSNYYFKNGRCIVTFKKSNKEFSYGNNRVKVERTALSDDDAFNVFKYLKEVANTVGLKNEDGASILSHSYNKITGISKDQVVAAFFNGTLPGRINKQADISFYPFGFNGSQRDAINNAFSHRLSIIEGPPGTGKTQTILNIITNALMEGSTVAVVSGNNAATKNVYEKLEKHGLDFMAAVLGSAQNKQQFIDSQKMLPDLSAFLLTDQEKANLRQQQTNLFAKISSCLRKQNELALLKQQLTDIETEYQHFTDCYPDGEISATALPEDMRSEKLLGLWMSVEKDVQLRRQMGWWKKLLYFLKFGIRNKVLSGHSQEEMIKILQFQYYRSKIAELTNQMNSITRELQQERFEKTMKTYTGLTMQLFKAALHDRYGKKDKERYSLEDLRYRSSDFIKDYPVILSTTYSLRQCLSSEIVYDYLIIDEASQVDLATGALALSCAKRAVIVGDMKQLPNVVDANMKIKADLIFNSYQLKSAYRYSGHSLLSSLLELFPQIPKTLLREHYRCHPKIIEFCNRKFYDDQLIILTEAKSERSPLIVYRTTQGNHARERMNQRQIDVIQQEIIPAQQLSGKDLGIVTPYRNQTNLLQQAFSGSSVKADTVDKFQGRENEVIILSTVDNDISDFTDDPNRLNVAVSRAIDQLILVVNGNDNNNNNISDLVQYIEYNNFSVIDSELNSIFDLLYKGYEEARVKQLKKSGKVSEFDSENLMFGLIKEVLKEPVFSRYDVLMNFPLRLMIKDFARLNPQERSYATHPLTHIDFLIYNKLGKRAVLAVEVDGFEFHKDGSRQWERDQLKDAILEKYKLPLLRFKTNESGEKRRLMNKLMELR